ncbi:MAG: hypothetical protein PHE88_06795 [Elusimicrobia bacterium]|nr:hypothetical protein [Elusimicrobiota bacterium]
MKHIFSYIIIGIVSGSAGAKIISIIASKIGLIDYPGPRSSHSYPIPKAGGIGIVLSVIFVCFLKKMPPVFCLLIILIALLGFASDRYKILPNYRFLGQLAVAALFIYYNNILSEHGLWISVFFILFIVATTNFFNFMDGINGLASFIGFIAFGLFALFSSSMVENHQVFIISLLLMASCAGFLPFNFPVAKVFMGDVGSIFLGFIFAVFVVKLSFSINVFLCLIMFLCVFYSDAILTIYFRWRKGENLFKAHRQHLYQYMCNELGLPHWKVTLLYSVVQIFFGILAIFMYNKGIRWQLVLLFVFIVFFGFSYKYVKNINPE